MQSPNLLVFRKALPTLTHPPVQLKTAKPPLPSLLSMRHKKVTTAPRRKLMERH
jgi:hypothetical protein